MLARMSSAVNLARVRDLARSGEDAPDSGAVRTFVWGHCSKVGDVYASTIARWEAGRRTPRDTQAARRYGAVLAKLQRFNEQAGR